MKRYVIYSSMSLDTSRQVEFIIDSKASNYQRHAQRLSNIN